jgi:hypothetical protein
LAGDLARDQNGALQKLSRFENIVSRFLNEDRVRVADLMTDAPTQILVEGKPHGVFVEIFNNETLGRLSKTGSGLATFGIYADPQAYYDGESDHIDLPGQVVTQGDESVEH